MPRYARWVLAGFAVAATALPVIAAANKPTPDEIAKHVIARVTKLADTYVTAADKLTKAAVDRIQTLLKNGKKAEAARVAKEAITKLDTGARDAVKRIEAIAKDGVAAIVKAGGSKDLVAKVKAAAAAQAKRVKDAHDADVQAVKNALK